MFHIFDSGILTRAVHLQLAPHGLRAVTANGRNLEKHDGNKGYKREIEISKCGNGAFMSRCSGFRTVSLRPSFAMVLVRHRPLRHTY